MKEMTPLEELRHSSAHVLATAVLRLFPEAKLGIGPRRLPPLAMMRLELLYSIFLVC